MSKRFEAILDECLHQVNRGESPEACAAQYPMLAAQLEPLLHLASQLQALRQEQEPSPVALQTARQQLLSEAARLKIAQEDKARAGFVPIWLNLQSLMRKSVATIILVALLLVTILGGGTIAASARSLPGDALYPVKRVTEEFQLFLTFDQQAKAQLRQKFEERRREEAKAIAIKPRIVEISFRGRIEIIDDKHWTIGGVTVNTSDETVIEGDVAVGVLVRVQARSLSDGTLLAIRISAEAEAVTPAATASPTSRPPKPTALPTPTRMPPTKLPVQLPAPTSTASPTSKPSPSATPSATATATFTPVTPTPPREVKVRFRGRIGAIAAGTWTIGDYTVRVDTNTRIDEGAGKATVGAMARVLAIRQEDDTLLAIEISIEQEAQIPAQPFEFQGLIESFGSTQWTVGGYTLIITPDTIIEGGPQKGLLAEVKALRQSDGSLVATHIVVRLPSEEVQFEGLIQTWSAEEWIVDGVVVRISAETSITGTPAVGYPVEVYGLLLPDGAVLARRIVVQPLPTIAPTPTILPGTATIEAVPGQTPTASSILPQQAISTDSASEPRQMAGIQYDITVGRRPSVKLMGWLSETASTYWLIGDHTLYMDPASPSTDNVNAGMYVIATAKVDDKGQLYLKTVSAQPSGSALGYIIEFRGVIQEIDDRYLVISNRLVFITESTSLRGNPQIGALAEVKGTYLFTDIVLARSIKVTVPGAYAEVEFEGVIESLSEGNWVVSGVTVLISPVTVIQGVPELGLTAEVLGILQPDNSVLAQQVAIKGPDLPQVDVEGLVERIEATYWVVAGTVVLVDEQTFIDDSRAPAEVGMWAQVRALRRRDGTLLALRIRLSRPS